MRDKSCHALAYARVMTKTILAILALAAACGSSSTSSSEGTFSTSVAATALLGDLSSAQETQLCNDLHVFSATTVYKNAVEGGCRLSGIIIAGLSHAQSDSDAEAACMNAYDSCKTDPASTNALSETNFACYGVSTSCKATVGQFAACLNDSFAALSQELAVLPTCSNLTRAGLAGDAGFPVTLPQPSSCATFVTNCPEAQR